MTHTLPRKLKSCLFICLMLAGFLPVKAQYVTIPDANFEFWLGASGFGQCMNGNQLDTTCEEILNARAIYCNSQRIEDITGIQYFKNLDSLDCSDNGILFLPPLPSRLTYLNCQINWIGMDSVGASPLPSGLRTFICGNNYFPGFAALPDSLSYFACNNNSIDSLPTLPDSLLYLDCSSNYIKTLPSLPRGMQFFSCDFNNTITYLPPLPDNLRELYCVYNKIAALPSVLPATLVVLGCDSNPLTVLPVLPSQLQGLSLQYTHVHSLPALPVSLNFLYCGYNQIDSLPALPARLQYLYCDYAQLSTLPVLPTGLLSLQCASNSFRSLPALPPMLNQLYCDYNQLTSLPALPPALQYLSCDNNKLGSLPALPAALQTVWCQSNKLAALPDLPPSLSTLYCAGNKLLSLPELPDSLNVLSCSENANLSCLPELKRIVTLDFQQTAVTCLPNYGNVTTSTPALSSVPLCGIFNPTGCGVFWNISGRSYYDVNDNCIFDSAEVGQNYIKMLLDSGGTTNQQVFTGGEGFYSFLANKGNYKVTVDTSNLPFTVECPAGVYMNDTLSAKDSLSYNNNFALKCRTEGFDIGVTSIINNYVIPRPNTIFGLNIIAGDISQLYGAHCASGISGQVQLIFNGPVTYAGNDGTLQPAVSGDTLSWNVADFGAINDYTAFLPVFYISRSAIVGSSICFTVLVTPATGDFNPSNNSLTYCFPVVEALDPNEKEVYPTTIDSANQWLTYTVRFQNTGTAPAVNIIVRDTLSPNLDPSTFQLLTYSAKNLTQVFGNVVVFNFPNINLPDSLTSDSASRGFVQYRVKTIANLQVGSVVSNKASIYFDLNAPVVTNTVSDTLPGQTACVSDTTNLTTSICNGDSVVVGGQAFYSSGNFTVTLTNTGGCDSVVNLQLTVNNRFTPVLFDTVCGSTVFNNQTLTQSGTYYDTLQSVNGCDSIVQLNLIVNNIPLTTIADTVCDSLVFNGQTYYQSGIYNDTLQAVNGCDSIVMFQLTVLGGHAMHLNDTILAYCPEGENYGACQFIISFIAQFSGPVDSFYWTITDPDIYDSMWTTGDTVIYNIDTLQISVQNGANVLVAWTEPYILCLTTFRHCSSDTFCTGFNFPESIQTVDANNAVSLYPNPANNLIYIKTEGLHPETITIYDVDGRQVVSQHFEPELDIHNLSPGVYLMEINSLEGVARKRWVKM